MKNLAVQLYNRTLELTGVQLDEKQSQKFKEACEKSVTDNPNLPLDHLLVASKMYLDFVLNVPGLSLESESEF